MSCYNRPILKHVLQSSDITDIYEDLSLPQITPIPEVEVDEDLKSQNTAADF